MFVAYSYDCCTAAPLTKYANNKILQELLKERNYFTKTDEKLYIHIRRSKGYTDKLEKLKSSATKKLRLRVTGYSQAEYYYILSNKGMIMSYKNYGISKEIDIAP